MKEEGEENILIEGSLPKVVNFLQDSYDLFDFIWEGIANENDISITSPYGTLMEKEKIIFLEKMPQLAEISTFPELQYELGKVDLGWWTLDVKEL